MHSPAATIEQCRQIFKTRKTRFGLCRTNWATAGMLAVFALCATSLPLKTEAQASGAYKVTNLLSDGSVPANVTDPTFINPWAISSSGTWWISTAGSGQNFVIGSTSATVGTVNFRVVIPRAGATTAGFPAGSVTTGGASGMILPNGTKASFLFSTLDGTITGWNSKLGTAGAVTQVVIDNSATGASYPGLAILNSATASYILAANFAGGSSIEVYDNTFKPARLSGTFTDPQLPAGYAPFSVHVLNNQVYVAYALRTATPPYRTVDAPGNGVVDIFEASGNFVARAATGGELDSPWGVAIAPANFGPFGGMLLIGNLGNGLIHAYDAKTFDYRGELVDGTGKPLTYASLWELLPGGTTVGNSTGVSGGDTSSLYFTAGLTGEAHGLFGVISNDTSSGTPTFGFSSATTAIATTGGTPALTLLSIAPTYGFNGLVKLNCSGLPKGATCTFTPSQFTASPTAPTTAIMTIQTSYATALLEKSRSTAGIATALMLPFTSILVFIRRRRAGLSSSGVSRMLGVVLLCGATLVGLGAVAGCSNYTFTPPGTSQVVVTATSGSVSQSTTIALTVK